MSGRALQSPGSFKLSWGRLESLQVCAGEGARLSILRPESPPTGIILTWAPGRDELEMPLQEALNALKTDTGARIGPYARAIVFLTIRDLFRLLNQEAQGQLLDQLVEETLLSSPQSEGEQGK